MPACRRSAKPSRPRGAECPRPPPAPVSPKPWITVLLESCQGVYLSVFQASAKPPEGAGCALAGRQVRICRGVAGADARRQPPHGRLGEEVAGKIRRVAEACPGFEAEKAMSRTAPQRQMREVLGHEPDRRAVRRLETQAAAVGIEKTEGVVL